MEQSTERTSTQMVLFLEGVVTQVTISDREYGSYLSINIVTGIAVMLGILIAGPVTGGHLNPAITFTFVVFRQFPLRKVPGFVISQVCFQFCAGAHYSFSFPPLFPLCPEQILILLASGWLYCGGTGLYQLQKRHRYY